jgi:hypothetical protein
MKTRVVFVKDYDSKRNQFEEELQTDIDFFRDFIRHHRKALKNYANNEYPFKEIINFISVSMEFSNGAGGCKTFESVVYPTINTAIPNKEDYLVESFSTNEIGGRKVRFRVFGPEKKDP